MKCATPPWRSDCIVPPLGGSQFRPTKPRGCGFTSHVAQHQRSQLWNTWNPSSAPHKFLHCPTPLFPPRFYEEAIVDSKGLLHSTFQGCLACNPMLETAHGPTTPLPLSPSNNVPFLQSSSLKSWAELPWGLGGGVLLASIDPDSQKKEWQTEPGA